MAALRLAFIFCAAVSLLTPAASALNGQQPSGGVLFVKQILKLFQKENIESIETTSSPSPTRLAESTAAATSEQPASTKLPTGQSKPAETAGQEKLRVPAKKPYKSRFTKESAPSKASTLAATTVASNAPTSKLCTVGLSGDNEWTCLAEQRCGVALQTTFNDLSALCLAGSTGGEPDCWASECAAGEECRLPGESFICACKSSDCNPAVKQLIELSEGTRQPLNPTGTSKPNAPAAAQAKNGLRERIGEASGTTATHWVLLCLIVLLMLAIVAVVVCLLCGCIC